MHAALGPYSALAVAALILHALFILWVVFGALVTRSRPVPRWLHIAIDVQKLVHQLDLRLIHDANADIRPAEFFDLSSHFDGLADQNREVVAEHLAQHVRK
jgi:hypothetical protein